MIYIHYLFFHKILMKEKSLNQNKSNKNLIPNKNHYSWSTQKLDRMYQSPPHFYEAMIHRQATKFGYKCSKILNQQKQQQIVPVCPCCNNLAVTYEYPLCYSTNPVQSSEQSKNLLPVQAIIYFSFIKYLIIYLCARFLILDVYLIYGGMNGSFCSNIFEANQKDLCAFTLSGYNLHSEADQQTFKVLDLLNFCFMIFSSIYMVFYKNLSDSYIERAAHGNASPSKFTLMITNLPRLNYEQDKNYQDAIRDKIQLTIKNHLKHLDRKILHDNKVLQSFQVNKELAFFKYVYQIRRRQINSQQAVIKVNLAFNIEQFQYFEKLRDQSLSLQRGSTFQQKKRQLNQSYILTCRQYTQSTGQAFYLTNFSGVAFVTLRYQYYTEIFQDKSVNFKNGSSKISQSIEPSDVNWEQLKHYVGQPMFIIEQIWIGLKQIGTNFKIITIVFVTFVALLGLQIWKNHLHQKIINISDFSGYYFTLVILALTFLVNKCTNYLLEDASNKQKGKTKTQKNFSLFLITLLYQFVIVILFFNIIYLIYPSNPLSQTGLATKALSLITINCGFNIGFQIAFQIYKSMTQISLFYKQQNKQFQININKDYEYPQFKFWKRYMFYIINAIALAYYSFLIPIATPALIIGFIIQYWVDKYTLFRKSTVKIDDKHNRREIINNARLGMLTLLLLTFIYAISYCVWGITVNFDQSNGMRVFKIVTILLIPVIFIVFVLIYLKCSGYGTSDYQKEQHQGRNQNILVSKSYNYYAENNMFPKTYENQNPLTFCRKHLIKGKTQQTDSNFIKREDCQKYLNIETQRLLFSTWNQKKQTYEWTTLQDMKINKKH